MEMANAGNGHTLASRAKGLDADDPLAGCRDRFVLPEGIIYLDGNSLGALPRGVAEKVTAVIDREWGRDLITSWNKAGWIDLPKRISAKIAALIGADEDCVAVTDSTSVNLFKVLSTALALRPGRRVIVSERDNFPTDLYVAEGLSAQLGGERTLKLADTPDGIASLVNEDTAVLMLTHVNYRTGRMHNMKQLTDFAQRAGALVVWDLAHSAGAVDLDIGQAGADFAVGCGYKYLNGGPGAPAFLYVARAHHDKSGQPLSGWFSHAAPFAFEPGYKPAAGIMQFYTGTPAILSLSALDVALDVWADVSIRAVREKSVALCDLFIKAVESLCGGHGLTLVTPRDPALRGSQVSFSVEADGYAIMQALIANGVIGDFRAPDIIRFGFTPLYTRFEDAYRAAEILARVLGEREWDNPVFKKRAAVT